MESAGGWADPILAAGGGGSGIGAEMRTQWHALALFPGMEPLLRALYANVDRARERIWVETYIYRADKLGRSFADRLARAAARGVDVRLLYDPKGSEKTDPAFFAELARRGIDVRPYRPLDVVLRTGDVWPRDHSRIIVVDGLGYTGGAAWGDEWLPRQWGGLGWHDVCSRVRGPCVDDFRQAFLRRWAEAAGALEQPVTIETGDRYPDLEFVADSAAHRNTVFLRHRERIRSARRRIWIEHAYFHPPAIMIDDLYAAARRGVDVRIIVPRDSDLPIIQRAARVEYGGWIAHGLQLFEYTPCMLHSKFAIIDDDWATVGSFNANVTSLCWSNETNLFFHDRRFVARVAALFLRDLASCERVTPASLEGRPVLDRIRDELAHTALGFVEQTYEGPE